MVKVQKMSSAPNPLTSIQSSSVRTVELRPRAQNFADRVGAGNPDDYFTFRLDKSSNLRLSLSGLRANADIALMNEQGRVLGVSARLGRSSENLQFDLAPGTYYVRIHATAGNTSYRLSASASPTRNPVAFGTVDSRPVLDWNSTLLQAIQADKTAPPLAARNMAIVNTAMHNAINSILSFSRNYQTEKVTASIWASPEAAVAGAAYQTLASLFPNQRAFFDEALGKALAKVPDGASEGFGFNLGVTVADQILALRSQDGANLAVAYTPAPGEGNWQPTPPAYAAPLLPQWPYVAPFAIPSGSAFRPAPPPAVNSAQYLSELQEVQSLGAVNSNTRTADQKEIALFWADGSGTYTPPGHWNAIASQAAQSRPLALFQDGRLFSLLSISLADAGICCWDAKYSYNQWRPITAIRQSSDPTWTPLITTPPFPDYTSGHSTFSGAASTVLANFFGDNFSFSTSSLGLPGIMRSYNSFSAAANEAGRSRILGGIHVESSNQAGLTGGRTIANYIIQSRLLG